MTSELRESPDGRIGIDRHAAGKTSIIPPLPIRPEQQAAFALFQHGIGQIATNYLSLSEHYPNRTQIIDYAAYDLVRLKVTPDIISDATSMTILMGIEEQYLSQMYGSASPIRSMDDPKSPIEARRERLGQIGLLLGQNGTSHSARIEASGPTGLFGLFHESAKSQNEAELHVRDALLHRHEALSGQLSTLLKTNTMRLLGIPITNLKLTDVELQDALSRIDVVVTSYGNREFRDTFHTDGVVYWEEENGQRRYRIVLPSVNPDALTDAELSIIRHEFTHCLGDISSVRRGMFGDIDRAANEAITELVSSVSDLEKVPNPNAAEVGRRHTHVYAEEILTMGIILSGCKEESLSLGLLADAYRAHDTALLDRSLVKRYGLSARAALAFYRCYEPKEEIQQFFLFSDEVAARFGMKIAIENPFARLTADLEHRGGKH